MRSTLGIRLIAAFYFVQALALVTCAVVGHLRPELRPITTDIIAARAPFIREMHLDRYSVILIPLLSCFDMALGLGVLFLNSLIRWMIVLDLSYRLLDAAAAASLLWEIDRQMLLSTISKPTFTISALIHAAILIYLVNPDIKQLFESKESDRPRELDW